MGDKKVSLELAKAGSQAEKILLVSLLICCSPHWLGDASDGVQVVTHKVSVPQQRAGRDSLKGAGEVGGYLHRAHEEELQRVREGWGWGGALPVPSHRAGI